MIAAPALRSDIKPYVEAALDPGQPIIDAHHHLYRRPDKVYLLDELAADLRSGHDVRATVFVQARAAYRVSGPDALRPIGETDFARALAEEARIAGLRTRICAGIVGYADLLMGDAVQPVLEGHIEAAGGTSVKGGRFCGVRHIAAWDAAAELLNPAYPTSEAMLASDLFRAGFARLAPLGLRFDAWLHFHQLPRLTDLARTFADTPIVVDHCGGILGIGPYRGRHDEVFAAWSQALRELAHSDNVAIKISGLGMPLTGLAFKDGGASPTSKMLADAWRPWVETCIETFGPQRCMFASNAPADQATCSYGVGWNAMKRIVAKASAESKDALFWRSARDFYALDTNDVNEDWVR